MFSIRHFFEKFREESKRVKEEIKEEKEVEETKQILTFDMMDDEKLWKEIVEKEIIKSGVEGARKKFNNNSEFILKYFPPEELTVSDCINGLFTGWSAPNWDSKMFEKIPERIYTDAQFLSRIKLRLDIIKRKSAYFFNYGEFKERFYLYAPDSVKLFVELECN